jgi:hypothetical protein
MGRAELGRKKGARKGNLGKVDPCRDLHSFGERPRGLEGLWELVF